MFVCARVQLSVWDLRTYKRVHSYYTPVPATSVDISQKGLLAVGYGTHTEIWKDALATKAKQPYLSHHSPGCTLQNLEFCPYEDVLGIGHGKGFSSIIVPGAGEPNFDTLEANPFQVIIIEIAQPAFGDFAHEETRGKRTRPMCTKTIHDASLSSPKFNASKHEHLTPNTRPLQTKKQRREGEVHKLLEKLQPDMITLDPTFIGNVDRAPAEVIEEEKRLALEASMSNNRKKREKRHARGRDKIGRKLKKKQGNIVEERKGDHRAHDKFNSTKGGKGKEGGDAEAPVGVLDRFKFRDT